MAQEYKYDLCVFVGRFQPYHLGHHQVVLKALELGRKVLVLAGSANRARSLRNPFTFEERREMIYDCQAGYIDSDRLTVEPLNDYVYSETGWLDEVRTRVHNIVDPGSRVCLIGHARDHTSYYLKLFPEWESYETGGSEITATAIRNWYLDQDPYKMNERVLPLPLGTRAFLERHRKTEHYAELLLEDDMIKTYKFSWSQAPYPPTFNAVDCVAICSGHVALIQRKDSPGKGMWALPGGFLDVNETLLDSAYRELQEETGLNLRTYGGPQKSIIFDDVHRDPRGRMITTGFLWNIAPDGGGAHYDMPRLYAGTDAAQAAWVPLGNLKANELWSDHFFIIKAMTAGL